MRAMKFDPHGGDRAEGDRRSDSQPEPEHRRAGEKHHGGRQKLEGHKNLTSIKGIGKLTGSILLASLAISATSPTKANWPLTSGSCRACRTRTKPSTAGGITKRGTKLGRTALMQCALIAQRYSPYLKTYYEKTKARRGTGKAIIALARKLLGIIYRTLKNNWVFEDFPNFVLAEES